MIRRPPRSTLSSSSAASDVYKRQHLSRYDWFKVDMAVNNILYEAVQVVWREKVRYDRVRPPSRIHDDLEGETITSYAGAFQGTQSMPCLLYTSPSPRDS
eukprot:TRINITY_DN15460_c0_g1_i3.p1 TRINITY_DN15460_c0_g1~~TRINITY_DN15460_c0_g1_i3.p1  ORF type:complete len:100 (-),score=36.92 TRINITY_DN15460_c0_g1_i3:50-349(-)